MSNSFEIDGTQSKFCSGGDPFVPNVFCGSIWSDLQILEKSGRYPSVALGLSDFSIEAWVKLVQYNPWSGADTRSGIGFWETRASDSDEIAIMEFFPDPVVNFHDGSTFAPGSIFMQKPRGWHYWVMNFDRSALCTIFLDGVIEDSFDISVAPLSLGSKFFMPLGGGPDFDVGASPGGTVWDRRARSDPGGDFPESLKDPFTQFEFLHVLAQIGPIALHVGGAKPLLDAADMSNAMSRRNVNELGSGTEIIYRWSDIQFDEGPLWDHDTRHAIRGVSDFAGRRFGCPRGTDETVRVPNAAAGATAGESMVLQTTSQYGQQFDFAVATVEDGFRGWTGFAADPFFSSGGGVPPGLV